MPYSESLLITKLPNCLRECSDVSSESSSVFLSNKESLGGFTASLYSKSSSCFSCWTLLLVSIFSFASMTSGAFIFSFFLTSSKTLCCLSTLSCLSLCFSLILVRKSADFSPNSPPNSIKYSCALIIKVVQDISKDKVSPNKPKQMKRRLLPIKLNGSKV